MKYRIVFYTPVYWVKWWPAPRDVEFARLHTWDTVQ